MESIVDWELLDLVNKEIKERENRFSMSVSEVMDAMTKMPNLKGLSVHHPEYTRFFIETVDGIVENRRKYLQALLYAQANGQNAENFVDK